MAAIFFPKIVKSFRNIDKDCQGKRLYLCTGNKNVTIYR